MASASNNNEYQECYLAHNLTTFWEPQSPGILWVCTGIALLAVSHTSCGL